MKNTVKINGINLTVEGCPVQLENIELTSEMSAQELATSGGLIKQLISELKPLIAEAIKPAVVTPAVTTTTPNYNNHNNRNNYKNNYGTDKIAPAINQIYDNKKNYDHSDNKNHKNIQKTFSETTKPECLTAKNGEWRWKEAEDSNNRCSVCVQNDEFNIVRIHIMSHNSWVHIHKYPSETKIDGCKFDQLPEFLKWSGIPEELQSYILKVVAL